MSGISGIINRSGFKPDLLKGMTDIIRHRGPDGEGFIFRSTDEQLYCVGNRDTIDSIRMSGLPWSPQSTIQELSDVVCTMGFGHRRLAIVDLSSAGHQPMSYGNNRYWICFNGSIYNSKEIRNELQELGYRFISDSDSEVVLAAYAEWGTLSLERFAGMWSFAIYDHQLKEIFLARDRFGIKPFYYWFSPDGSFYFASEIKQFTVLDEWKAKMNPPRVYDYLIYSFTDHTDETLFADVFQLPSGTYFKSSINDIKPDKSGRIGFSKWYSLKREPFKGTFTEAAEKFRILFENSVREHLYSDVSVGAALSGGLDSSSIVCEADRLRMSDRKSDLLKTFSSCSVDERYSEKRWIDIVSEHTNIDAYCIFPEMNDVIEHTPEVVWHLDEPYQSQSALLGFKLFGLAKAKGIKVILNGQGADEYLGGYGQFTMSRYAKLIKKFRFLSLINDINNLRNVRPVTTLNILQGIFFQILPDPILRFAGNIRSSSDQIKKLIDFNRSELRFSHPHDLIPVRYQSVPEISEHLMFYSTLPKYLKWEDRNSMANSVEARVPFLDHRLVEFSYNLPDEFLEKDGINKRVLREAMTDLLPVQIKNRKDKMGFITPEELWVKRDNTAWFRQKLEEAVEVSSGIVTPESLIYFDNVVNETIPFDYTYWRLILFSEWIQKFQVST